MTLTDLVDIDRIKAARRRLANYVQQSPLVLTFSGMFLKAENLHITGAFKIRGAFNSLLCLTDDERRAGVIAPSSGNHAQAVACAASRLGVPAVLVMPTTAPKSKVRACQRWGSEVIVQGADAVEIAQVATDLARERGLVNVEPYDSPRIIEATGVIGLEILEQLPDAQSVYVPISGGGLVSGIAAAIKSLRPDTKVIGVEPELASDAALSFHSGELQGIPASDAARTIADGLRVPVLSDLTWHHIRTLVDDIVTVDEEEILEAMSWIAIETRIIAEPSGAVSVAAARKSTEAQVVAVVSGGNQNILDYARSLSKGVADDTSVAHPPASL